MEYDVKCTQSFSFQSTGAEDKCVLCVREDQSHCLSPSVSVCTLIQRQFVHPITFIYESNNRPVWGFLKSLPHDEVRAKESYFKRPSQFTCSAVRL